ncbi:hypothetical protein FRE64_07570 [Euhalothece natronophila Z-M001]|uniref:Uncharacterized protein n=1 Tax=Euhalothece natronophila Z-M001 TaxID=522448 RepID=A0A5B8NMP8_9CHRO|nr:hypothetical protein [Euhalothece natronophila]QDZ39811.1 hypothetical protein FRE64_07570 [Euhalothece natronophila Z-M001]
MKITKNTSKELRLEHPNTRFSWRREGIVVLSGTITIIGIITIILGILSESNRIELIAFGIFFILAGGFYTKEILKYYFKVGCIFDKNSEKIFLIKQTPFSLERDINESYELSEIREAKTITKKEATQTANTTTTTTRYINYLIFKSGARLKLDISGSPRYKQQINRTINEFLRTTN